MLEKTRRSPETGLARFGTATIHEAQGRVGAVHASIRPIDPAMRVLGTAFTVRCQPGDNLALHYALTKAGEGDVLVVDAAGCTESGPWGDVMSSAAIARGVAGLVIDGAVRDSQSIIEMGFPVFARGLCIKGTSKLHRGEVGVPVALGGVIVRPGDVVAGDRDGVVVVRHEEVDTVRLACEVREEKEEEFRAQLRSGKTTVELLELGPLLQSFGMN